MSTYNGRTAKVVIGTFVVAEFASFDLDLSNDEIDTTAFGSTWKKSDVGMRGWSAACSGHVDPSDGDGQGALEAAWAAASLITDIKFYYDNTSYWTPDVTTDSDAGGRVTTYTVAFAHDGVGSVSFTVSGSGPLTFV
jgi:hypothetical protein